MLLEKILDVVVISMVFFLPGKAIYGSVSLPWEVDRYFSFIFSSVFSFSILPLLLFWTGLLFGFSEGVIYATSIGFSVLLCFLKKLKRSNIVKRKTYIGFSSSGEKTFFFVFVICLITLVYIPFALHGHTASDGDVYSMAFSGDWYKHLTIASSLANNNAMPPQNPYIYTKPPLNYYYFIYILSAVPVKISGVSVYSSLLFVSIFSAFLFLNVMFLFGKIILRKGALLFTFLGIFVGGFDMFEVIIYGVKNLLKYPNKNINLHFFLTNIVPTRHIDFWVTDWERRISSIYTSFLWVPQHVSGVMILLLVIILFLAFEENVTGVCFNRDFLFGNPFSLFILTSALFASMMGFSVYICIGGIFIFVGLFAFRTNELRKSRRINKKLNTLWHPVFLGIASFVFLIPFLKKLLNYSGQTGLIFHVSSCGNILNGAFFTSLFGTNSQLGHLLDIPMYYALEFGPLLVIGCVGVVFAYKQPNKYFNKGGREIAFTLLLTPLIYIFVRPPYPGPNNLQGRNALITFVALSLFAAIAIWEKKDKSGRTAKFVVSIILILGFTANIYECIGESVSPLFKRKVPVQVAQAFEWIKENTPPEATVQFSGKIKVDDFGFFAERSTALADKFHTELFLSGKINYYEEKKRLYTALQSNTAYRSWIILHDMNINYLMIDSEDTSFYKNTAKFKNKKFFLTVYENKRITVIKLINHLPPKAINEEI